VRFGTKGWEKIALEEEYEPFGKDSTIWAAGALGVALLPAARRSTHSGLVRWCPCEGEDGFTLEVVDA
jgi:hypothetical protein